MPTSAWTSGMARTRSSATATRCSAPTSSITVATRRWAAPGATWTSPRSGGRRSGRTRPTAIPRSRRTPGGGGTTPTTMPPEVIMANDLQNSWQPAGGAPRMPAAVDRAALAATLGLAAACWAVSVWQMNGMDMGTATPLGSFGFFIAVWAAMMAAMMLPGAAPAVLRRAQAGGVRAVPLFVGSYLAVWALAGVLVYTVDRPHGTVAAGLVAIA